MLAIDFYSNATQELARKEVRRNERVAGLTMAAQASRQATRGKEIQES